MLVLSRTPGESIQIGNGNAVEIVKRHLSSAESIETQQTLRAMLGEMINARPTRVVVIGCKGRKARIGLDSDRSNQILRSELVDRQRAAKAKGPLADHLRPVA